MEGDMEEGMGESQSPPRTFTPPAPASEIKKEVYMKLVESGNPEAVNPEFREQLDAHFGRLPPSYALDVNADKAEDVLIHRRILAEAKDIRKRPVFHVRFKKGFGIDFEPCSKLDDLDLDMKKEAMETEDEMCLTEALSTRQEVTSLPVHEIVFSTIDRPKLLSKLSALLSDIGLNIREAHVFSTTDGYSLDVFSVDGWPHEDTDGLHKMIEEAITRYEGLWAASTQSSVAEILAAQPKAGNWEINKCLLTMGEKIASGASGDLYHGTYRGNDVAVKVLRSEDLTDAQGLEFAQELLILREVQHANVVRFVGACTKPPQLCILTEYMPGGNLYDFLHKHPNTLDLSMLLKFALDVCKGMDYLHQNNIIHRDLKTANLLMDKNHVIKVADFGVARFQSQPGVMTAETGTYRWMAPEVMNHKPYDQKADVFSFAIVLWELATSKIPYDKMTPLQAAVGVRQGLRPELPLNADPRLLDLMQRCWETAPAKRPTFREITIELENILRQVQATGETSDQRRDTSQ